MLHTLSALTLQAVDSSSSEEEDSDDEKEYVSKKRKKSAAHDRMCPLNWMCTGFPKSAPGAVVANLSSKVTTDGSQRGVRGPKRTGLIVVRGDPDPSSLGGCPDRDNSRY